MHLIPYDSVEVTDRQRKKISTPELNELKESILQRGLLMAPVVRQKEDGKYSLVAGERRYRAVGLIHKEGKPFEHNLITVESGKIPVTLIRGTELLAKEAELDENIQRVDLTWQEKAAALADIHKEKQVSNPKQTFTETAKEISSQAKVSVDYGRTAIREAVIVAEHLHRPSIANARSASEAHQLILKAQHEKVTAELARRRIAKMGVTPDIEITHGDLFEQLPRLDGNIVDLICVDVPFGIDAGGGGFRARTVHHHNYEDSEEISWEIQKAILTEGFRICKPQANILMFTDIKWWDRLQRVSAQIGWVPFRRPMIWGKSDSEGLAPWGAGGPRITTEFIFYATKGQKGMVASPTDYIRVNRVPRHERIHAAQKPVELMEKLIHCATLPGDLVLDPCCGSGSTLIAARNLKRRARGIEKDQDYYNTAMANVHGTDSAIGSVGTPTKETNSVRSEGS